MKYKTADSKREMILSSIVVNLASNLQQLVNCEKLQEPKGYA